LYLWRTIWSAVLVLVISVYMVKMLSNKIIESDDAYKSYDKNRDSLMDNMGMEDLKFMKVDMVASYRTGLASCGVDVACVICRTLYGG